MECCRVHVTRIACTTLIPHLAITSTSHRQQLGGSSIDIVSIHLCNTDFHASLKRYSKIISSHTVRAIDIGSFISPSYRARKRHHHLLLLGLSSFEDHVLFAFRRRRGNLRSLLEPRLFRLHKHPLAQPPPWSHSLV
jgi:hypothetical protein